MPNAFKIRKRGKRSGAASKAARLRDIHSKIDGLPSGSHAGHAHNLHGSSAAAATMQAAKYFECAHIEETREDHIIPRQSLTRQQYLSVLPQRIETEPIPTKQLDHRSGNMVETTDNRQVWKSDRTLLRRNKPFEEIGTFKREGAIIQGANRRKTITTIPEVPQSQDEQIIGVSLDADSLEDL